MGQRVSGQSGGGQVKGQVKGQRVHGKVWCGREGVFSFVEARGLVVSKITYTSGGNDTEKTMLSNTDAEKSDFLQILSPMYDSILT